MEVVGEFGAWSVVIPDRPVTAAQLAICRPERPRNSGDLDAEGLLEAYRRVRSALHTVSDCEAFNLSLALEWRPAGPCLGEPEPVDSIEVALHIFGRHQDETQRPVRQLARPASEREIVPSDPGSAELLAAAMITAPDFVPEKLSAEAGCDGCTATVLTEQERWRQDGVRVIRPRHPTIDANVLIMPLRHVGSVGQLTADEVRSIGARLRETLDQFRQSSGSTGLSCFLNDGRRAGQETPHVHLHVFGRSHTEPVNPFAALARRLGIPSQR